MTRDRGSTECNPGCKDEFFQSDAFGASEIRSIAIITFKQVLGRRRFQIQLPEFSSDFS